MDEGRTCSGNLEFAGAFHLWDSMSVDSVFDAVYFTTSIGEEGDCLRWTCHRGVSLGGFLCIGC